MQYTKRYSECIDKIKDLINNADGIVIGGGAGLSASCGFDYSGERFEKYFKDFEEKYGIKDMYSGGFYPFESLREYWAWWSRQIFYNRYSQPPLTLYKQLFDIVKDKDYFVITTNVDHCFQKTGFEKDRLFYMQGDYGLFQCGEPCHNKTYDNEEIIRRMVNEQADMKIPEGLIPRCPVCGRPMTTNLRIDGKFVQDDGWYKSYDNYCKYNAGHKRGKIVYLELGVGSNTPSLIKFPFWRKVYDNDSATYVCINNGEAYCPDEIESRAVCVNEDIRKVICDIK